MRLNREKIFKKFREIDEAMGKLERFKSVPKEEFIENTDYNYIAYAGFVILTEAVIDICFHISAKKLKKAPTEYAECFNFLKENNLLDPQTSDILSEMARFRNLLIHGYGKVDFGKVHNYISDSLWAINVFKEKVKSLVEAE
ncbi:MAG: DUF86 domain-containing protein [Nitrospirae bacterium]|nr:DUF86 domain-containing protein [Nitrospirota bacterium]